MSGDSDSVCYRQPSPGLNKSIVSMSVCLNKQTNKQVPSGGNWINLNMYLISGNIKELFLISRVY